MPQNSGLEAIATRTAASPYATDAMSSMLKHAASLLSDPEITLLRIPARDSTGLWKRARTRTEPGDPLIVPYPRIYAEFSPPLPMNLNEHFGYTALSEEMNPAARAKITVELVGMMVHSELHEMNRQIGAGRNSHASCIVITNARLGNDQTAAIGMARSFMVNMNDHSLLVSPITLAQAPTPELVKNVETMIGAMKLPLTSIPADPDPTTDTPMTKEIRLYAAMLRGLCAYLESNRDLTGPERLSRQQRRQVKRDGLTSRWLTVHGKQPSVNGKDEK